MMPPEPVPQATEEVLAHVLLCEEACQSEALQQEAVQAVVEASGLHDWDEGRLRRFGILSGWVRRDRLEAIRALPAVQSVSENQERQY